MTSKKNLSLNATPSSTPQVSNKPSAGAAKPKTISSEKFTMKVAIIGKEDRNAVDVKKFQETLKGFTKRIIRNDKENLVTFSVKEFTDEKTSDKSIAKSSIFAANAFSSFPACISLTGVWPDMRLNSPRIVLTDNEDVFQYLKNSSEPENMLLIYHSHEPMENATERLWTALYHTFYNIELVQDKLFDVEPGENELFDVKL